MLAYTKPLVDNVSPGSLLPRNESRALPLVSKLCGLMAAEGISYCHWKSNNALDRSASGDNDLDLLVREADGPRCEQLLKRLGFKPATTPSEKAMPGVVDYFAYVPDADRFVHVHLHYHLILGHDASKNFRLPIEKEYLASATDGELFRVPAVEFEFVVFVVRMVLKHLAWDLVLGGEGKLKASEQRELGYLLARINQERVYEILTWHLPSVSPELFDQCVTALQPKYPLWTRLQIGQEVHARLHASARRPQLYDLGLKLWRRFAWPVRRRAFKRSPKYRLPSQRSPIALVGGDGAGKSTVVKALHSWLGKYFATQRLHLGKPAWSTTTTMLRGILKLGHLLGLYPAEASLQTTLTQHARVSPGYPWLIREVCLARDRYHSLRRAQEFSQRGGIVICDRFPLPHVLQMDGPQTRRFVRLLNEQAPNGAFLRPTLQSWFTRWLVKREEHYYAHMGSAGLLIGLVVDPEIAVQRKTDEDAAMVRARATEVWHTPWEQTDAYIVDSGQPVDKVLSELKTLIWVKL